MKTPLPLTLALLLVSLLLLPSCLHNRRQAKETFIDFPELGTMENPYDATNELSLEQHSEKAEALKELAKQPYPPFTIGAGDLLNIRVYDHDDLNTTTPVTPDGHIGMLFAEEVSVSGLTIPEACKAIEEQLKKYIKAPTVGISPVEIHSQVATISGGVKYPGVYPVYAGMRLSDLYATAGGTSTRYIDGQDIDAADFRFSIFVRGETILAIDFAAAIEQGDFLHNVRIHAGDYIYIAIRSESMVTICGEVVRPHHRLWTQSLSVLELIAAAEGLKETYWRYGIIIRGGFSNPRFYRVDLDGIMLGRKRNVRMESGDILYIPRDDISEYNVFVRKLMPTMELLNLILNPYRYWHDK